MPVIWRHPGPLSPGRTGSEPATRGVPFLYLESTDGTDGPGRYPGAVLRVMAAAGMIDTPPAPDVAAPRRLVGPGDLDVGGVVAGRSGLIDVHVEVLDTVAAGAVVADIVDPRDGGRETVTAPRAGVVAMHRRTASVTAGELVAFLTDDEDERA